MSVEARHYCFVGLVCKELRIVQAPLYDIGLMRLPRRHPLHPRARATGGHLCGLLVDFLRLVDGSVVAFNRGDKALCLLHGIHNGSHSFFLAATVEHIKQKCLMFRRGPVNALLVLEKLSAPIRHWRHSRRAFSFRVMAVQPVVLVDRLDLGARDRADLIGNIADQDRRIVRILSLDLVLQRCAGGHQEQRRCKAQQQYSIVHFIDVLLGQCRQVRVKAGGQPRRPPGNGLARAASFGMACL